MVCSPNGFWENVRDKVSFNNNGPRRTRRPKKKKLFTGVDESIYRTKSGRDLIRVLNENRNVLFVVWYIKLEGNQMKEIS
jgi:hypothetical protein